MNCDNINQHTNSIRNLYKTFHQSINNFSRKSYINRNVEFTESNNISKKGKVVDVVVTSNYELMLEIVSDNTNYTVFGSNITKVI
jgi:hypothetical protein